MPTASSDEANVVWTQQDSIASPFTFAQLQAAVVPSSNQDRNEVGAVAQSHSAGRQDTKCPFAGNPPARLPDVGEQPGIMQGMLGMSPHTTFWLQQQAADTSLQGRSPHLSPFLATQVRIFVECDWGLLHATKPCTLEFSPSLIMPP
jgi:hypothetical protein